MPWRTVTVDVDEAAFVVADPLLSALNTALAKARAAEPSGGAGEVIVAADTVVLADDQLLGKPSTAEQAFRMLSDLRARSHQVLSGVALRADDGRQWAAVVSTLVFMRHYSPSEIDAYVSRGEPFDKAGAYGIQDQTFRPVDRLEGCYLNVVGLPLCAVAAGLAALGVESRRADDPRPPCSLCRAGAQLVAIA